MKEKSKKALKTVLLVAAAGGVIYILNDRNNLKERVKILEEIVSEEVLDEAIATTTRKLNYRMDKIKVYEMRDGLDSKEKLKEHIYFKELFEKRLKDFNKLKAIRYIEK